MHHIEPSVLRTFRFSNQVSVQLVIVGLVTSTIGEVKISHFLLETGSHIQLFYYVLF